MFNTHLEEFVQSINLDEDIFVVFDLNQNWFDSKGTLLRRVCEQNGFENFVCEATRDVYTTRNNNLVRSSSLIDVILHNGSAIEKCVPFMLPFSDYSMVMAVCNFDTLSFSPQLPISRALNEAKLDCRDNKLYRLFYSQRSSRCQLALVELQAHHYQHHQLRSSTEKEATEKT